MKQTNNAIKFLMAQYRAIFKNANLKMFLAAATAAAALAAGQAQAAQGSTFKNDGFSATAPVEITITGKADADDAKKQYKNFTISGGAGGDGDAVFTNSQQNVITVTGGKDGDQSSSSFAGTGADKTGSITLDKTTLNIEGATDTPSETLVTVGGEKAVTLQLDAVNVKKGQLEIGKAGQDKVSTLNANKVTVDGQHAEVNLKKKAVLGGTEILVKSGSVSLGDGASISSSAINVSGGTVSLSGSDDANKSTLGSADSVIAIAGGEVKSEGSKHGAITGSMITLSDKGKIANGEALTITAGEGGFTANGGTIENKTADKTITFVGNTDFQKGTTVVNSGSLAFKGNATIADGVTLTLGDNAVTKVIANGSTTSKLTLSKATFGTLTAKDNQKISVSGAAAGDTMEVHFTDDVVNFGTTGGLGIIKDADGKIEAKKIAFDGGNNGKLKLSADKAELKIAKIDQENLEISANELTVGTGASFIVSGGSTLEVGHLLTVDDGTKELKIQQGTVDLVDSNKQAGNTIKSKSITIGEGANSGSLNVSAGEWTVSGVNLVKGSVDVVNDAVLHLEGDLTTTTNGKLTGSDTAHIDATKVETLKLGATSVELNNSAVLDLDAADVFDAKGDVVTGAFEDAAVSGSSTSIINFKSGDGFAKLSKEKFQAFSKKANFAGLWGVEIDGLVPDGTTHMGLGDDGIIAGVGKGYQDVQADVDGTKAVELNYSAGNVHLTKGDALTIGAGAMTLQNANANSTNGMFVSTGSGSEAKLAGVKFGSTATESSAIKFEGAGSVGSIITESAGKGRIEVGGDVKNPADVTVSGSVGSSTAAIGELAINNGSLTVKGGDVTVNTLKLAQGTELDATGQKVTVGDTSKKIDANLMGGINAGTLTFTSNTDGGKVTLAGNAESNIGELVIGAKQELVIGQGGVEASEGVEGSSGSFAQVYADKLILAEGSTLFLDPAYGEKASLLVSKDFANSITPGTDSDVLKSDLIVGTNSALGIGFDKEGFGELMADYLVKNGGFSDAVGDVHNALVLGKPLKIADGKKLDIDHTKTTSAPNGKLSIAAQGNEVLIAPGSALILTEGAFGPNGEAAIQFQGTAGTIVGGTAPVTTADAPAKVDVPKIILEGDFNAKDTVNLASVNNGGIKPASVKGKLLVEAYDGLLSYELNETAGSNTASFVLKYNDKKEGEIRAGVSSPIAQVFLDKAKGTLEVVPGSVGFKFLRDSMKSAEGRKAFDAAAHAATYAGAQVAAVASVGTMADAVGARVGTMGVEATAISATGSAANGGVWVAPMYKSVDADGFGAEGASYGAEVDLAGVAFGTDTVNGNMRFGAVFNIGSGDSDGKGNGAGLKDEFDYYGFGMYSVMGFGQFALVGDASLNVISHDVSGLNAKGSADTTAVTMGVTGQYTISNPMVDVTPHFGARFIRLDTDSYALNTADGVLAETDFDVQNVFSIPLGVTLSKAIEMGGWSLAPSADLTLTFNTGDTDANSTTRFNGIKRDIGLTTEVLDEVTYGVAVGLGAQYGAFGTHFGISYTGSENTDAFGVNAQARYMF